MLERDQIIGKRIVRLLQTPWTAFDGMEIEGIAGKRWFSCDCFVELEGGRLVKLDAEDITFEQMEMSTLIPADPMGEEPQLFLREKIVQVVTSSLDDQLMLVLEHGRYIENNHNIPGGNRFYLGTFDEWSREDKDAQFLDFWDRTPVIPWKT
ncbi:MAG TPA: hypothetical protein VNM14_13615 [Planctomycetota bacterium]|jgi:hypothetical protein|nr:hypothetical protein [Planctomycetota bacterium]